MTTPALAYGLLLASALAAIYHLLLGQSLRQLPWFWIASLLGFAAGQMLVPALPVRLPALGLLHPIEGGILALAAMTVVRSVRL
ncbi:MAG: hypothetical protein GXX93_01640 [Anaerolineae bacterium]|nr:hypothetical protein [Anaerolineae bacterium]